MRAAWIALIALMGWSGIADARPAGPKPPAHRMLLAEEWKSVVGENPGETAAEQRWRLDDPIAAYAPEGRGIRWRLHGAKVKLRMPLALH